MLACIAIALVFALGLCPWQALAAQQPVAASYTPCTQGADGGRTAAATARCRYSAVRVTGPPQWLLPSVAVALCAHSHWRHGSLIARCV